MPSLKFGKSDMREVLGTDVGPCEDRRRAFMQALVARGVHCVKLVTSDAHPGLKQAIAEVIVGAAWMRCRVLVLERQSEQERVVLQARPWRRLRSASVVRITRRSPVAGSLQVRSPRGTGITVLQGRYRTNQFLSQMCRRQVSRKYSSEMYG